MTSGSETPAEEPFSRKPRPARATENAVQERAWPGMPLPKLMSEHASRYAFALGMLGGMRVLDLGCGTGYGSEMLSWSAASVHGFDVWQPPDAERPRWPSVQDFTYGHDLCRDPLPKADAAVMFEVIEHLPDAPRALTTVFDAVPALICSFPNPDFHGSTHNPFHVNDWPLEQVEAEIQAAAGTAGRGQLHLEHFHQVYGSPLIRHGRAPYESVWIFVASADPSAMDIPFPRRRALGWKLRQRLRLRNRLGLR